MKTIRKNKNGTGGSADPRIFSNLTGYGLFSGLRARQNRNKCTVFKAFVELDIAIHHGKDRVILTHAHTCARPELGTALTHDDIAGDDGFATVFFHAKATTS